MNNQELLDAACPLINDMGAAFYFIPETLAVGKAMGLGGMEFYVQGRAGQMGNTEPEAVAAAFGYFKPALLKSILDSANAKSEPRVTGAAFMNACATLSRAKLSGVANLDALVAVLDKVNNAADGDGLALYAAINSEKLAEDAAGRLLQLIAILREYRGSAHLVALRAAGVNSRTAHYMKRPDMWKQFGYTEEEAPEVTDAVKAARAEAENITDRIVEPAFAVLSDAERTVLVDGLHAVKAALAA
ncbi:unannotated protein [freshwater metagenome]|uniref:Unannotated protein n=1 Tax=freshwater metagenome TaxID=449393 RepID=A0A6J6IEL2_9ZZZZ|nr:hypothetical protein [Actinomycetota bacterium]